MSDVLEQVKASQAWDARFGLPVCPSFNNPWIYGAYALKVMRVAGLTAIEEVALVDRFIDFAKGCRIKPGLFNRWPDGGGGVTSHDELMGMAFISKNLAKEIVAYLDETDGVYLNKPEEKADHPNWEIRFNVYRMVFLLPFLRARAGHSLNLASQLVFAAHLWKDAFSAKATDTGNAGGRLRNWLMLDTMEKTGPIASAGVWYWRSKMKALGFSPGESLAKEPGIPQIAGAAPKGF